MGLTITQLELREFRNYQELTIEPDSRLTIFVGPNAAGKTSIIEAIQILTSGSSFRASSWADVVRQGSGAAKVALQAEGDGRHYRVDLEIKESGRRVFRVNNKTKRSTSEIRGVLPCVVFTPDDLRLVKDSAARRRGAIDEVGDQLSSAYSAIRAEYDHILRQRNSLLKEETIDAQVLDLWTEKLVETGVSLSSHRRRLFDRIRTQMVDFYASLTDGEEMEATYVDSWCRDGQGICDLPSVEAMREGLRQKWREERARGVTVIGPHRDEVVFCVAGREARAYASQGQQRTVALAWKLAEVVVMTEVSGQEPVLLLDDVMSELDETRREKLAEFVGAKAQTFMTTTNIGYFDESIAKRAKVVSIGEAGR